MESVFSHIVRRRLPQEHEDVATEALAYILSTSQSARRGINSLLRSLAPEIPELHFQTQQTEGSIRPDMWGYADGEPRTFIENKFWAGLTESQPIAYLEQLRTYTQPTVLLIIAPASREQAIWREVTLRLDRAELSYWTPDAALGGAQRVTTHSGSIVALTSWDNVLGILEQATVEDPRARGDLVQLRSLCDAADDDAFIPVGREALSDQRAPAFILQLSSIVQTTTERAITEGLVKTDGLRPQASWDQIGRYVAIPGKHGAGAWFGTQFRLWKTHGLTPIWLTFPESDWGRASEVRRVLEPWVIRNGLLTVSEPQHFSIALEIPAGEEKPGVVETLLGTLREVSHNLSTLPGNMSFNGE